MEGFSCSVSLRNRLTIGQSQNASGQPMHCPFPPIYPTELKVLRNAQKIFRSTQKCSNEILAEVLLRSTLATGCHRHQLHQLHQNQMTPSPRKRCPRNLCSNCSSSNPLGPLSAGAFDESVPLHLCICFS